MRELRGKMAKSKKTWTYEAAGVPHAPELVKRASLLGAFSDKLHAARSRQTLDVYVS